ncbi:hypothetical protein ACI1HK_002405 [Vibrio fluvialis]
MKHEPLSDEEYILKFEELSSEIEKIIDNFEEFDISLKNEIFDVSFNCFVRSTFRRDAHINELKKKIHNIEFIDNNALLQYRDKIEKATTLKEHQLVAYFKNKDSLKNEISHKNSATSLLFTSIICIPLIMQYIPNYLHFIPVFFPLMSIYLYHQSNKKINNLKQHIEENRRAIALASNIQREGKCKEYRIKKRHEELVKKLYRTLDSLEEMQECKKLEMLNFFDKKGDL